MKQPVLSVLIVGCGNIGGGFDQTRSRTDWPLSHAGAYARHGGFRVTACADPDVTRRKAFQRHWGVRTAFDSCAQATSSGERWDIVSICSPTANHFGDLMIALQAHPRLIFCEKPLSPTAIEAEAIVQACAAAGVLLAVNHTRRWAPDIRELGRQLAAGGHGELRGASARYSKGILNNGSHLVDLLSLWLGPLSLLSAGHAFSDFWPDDPTVPALLASGSGAGISIGCAHATDYSLFEVELVTSTAVIAMEDGGLAWRLRLPGPSAQFAGYRALDGGRRLPGRYMEAMTGAAHNIYDAVMKDSPLLSTGVTALEAQRLCESIRAAAPAPTRSANP
ncbi:MAG: Gfo/Idh/MocA family oxidoreductase [Acidovorax sp.]|nr:Gfo/Idh/MocA family oxidoreductase [Acidovorax sp.]